MKSGQHISLEGLPRESGHYYCSVDYEGFEAQSIVATLSISGKYNRFLF